MDALQGATGRLCLLNCYLCTKTQDKEKSILCPLDVSLRQKGFGVARSGRMASYVPVPAACAISSKRTAAADLGEVGL